MSPFFKKRYHPEPYPDITKMPDDVLHEIVKAGELARGMSSRPHNVYAWTKEAGLDLQRHQAADTEWHRRFPGGWQQAEERAALEILDGAVQRAVDEDWKANLVRIEEEDGKPSVHAQPRREGLDASLEAPSTFRVAGRRGRSSRPSPSTSRHARRLLPEPPNCAKQASLCSRHHRRSGSAMTIVDRRRLPRRASEKCSPASRQQRRQRHARGYGTSIASPQRSAPLTKTPDHARQAAPEGSGERANGRTSGDACRRRSFVGCFGLGDSQRLRKAASSVRALALAVHHLATLEDYVRFGRRTSQTIPNTSTAAARIPNAIQPH